MVVSNSKFHLLYDLVIGGSESKETVQCRRPGFDSWVGKIPWSRKWQPIPVFLTGEFHGQRSLAGYSLWGHKEVDTTEHETHNKVIFHTEENQSKVNT